MATETTTVTATTPAENKALQSIFREALNNGGDLKAVSALISDYDVLGAMEDLAAAGILVKFFEPHNGSMSVVFRPGDGFWAEGIFAIASTAALAEVTT